jgi:hypothetical protein
MGLAKELDQNKLFPSAILLDRDWRSQVFSMNYDLVFQLRFPAEDPQRPMLTKAEICCEKELGIQPIAKYPQLVPKKIVAVHFHSTTGTGTRERAGNLGPKNLGRDYADRVHSHRNPFRACESQSGKPKV